MLWSYTCTHDSYKLTHSFTILLLICTISMRQHGLRISSWFRWIHSLKIRWIRKKLINLQNMVFLQYNGTQSIIGMWVLLEHEGQKRLRDETWHSSWDSKFQWILLGIERQNNTPSRGNDMRQGRFRWSHDENTCIEKRKKKGKEEKW